MNGLGYVRREKLSKFVGETHLLVMGAQLTVLHCRKREMEMKI
jgi:hypothetical protein